MLFNSLGFIIIFPLLVVLYYVLPVKFRGVYLLIASFLFYLTWEPGYLLLLVGVIIANYFLGIGIKGNLSPRIQGLLFALGMTANIGLLFTYKYFAFFNESIKSLLGLFEVSYNVPSYQFILPVGISFFTLQNLSYLLDVRRGNLQPERSILRFALYVSFFPKLTAGPIERAGRFLPQTACDRQFDSRRVVDGARVLAWGLFKKMVVADRLALLVNPVFTYPESYPGLSTLLGVYLYTIQIYLDFSAYSEIAIGAAQMLGFDLTENFRRPYFSTTVTEFWNRWHITLSTWLRDYIFFPVRRSLLRRYRGKSVFVDRVIPPMVTMLVSGLWHGANWTYVLWGALHGLFLIISEPLDKGINGLFKLFSLERFSFLSRIVKIAITFNLLAFSFIVFRAASVSNAFVILSNIANPMPGNILTPFLRYPAEQSACTYLLILLPILFIIEIFQEKLNIWSVFDRQPTLFRWAVYYILAMSIIMLSSDPQVPLQFLYFKF